MPIIYPQAGSGLVQWLVKYTSHTKVVSSIPRSNIVLSSPGNAYAVYGGTPTDDIGIMCIEVTLYITTGIGI